VSESPAATAIALISNPLVSGVPIGSLIDCQLGPVRGVLGVLASFVRHSDNPPASTRSGSLGSSTNGAMNSAFGRLPVGGGMASGML
jgi:hypothetical protein